MSGLKDKNELVIANIMGRNLKKLRDREHLTQEQMAAIAGCSEESIGKVERGLQTMKFWRMIRLCDYFHVSLDYFLRDYDPSAPPHVPSYVVKLFQDADESELELLNDQMSIFMKMFRRLRDKNDGDSYTDYYGSSRYY